MEAQYASGIEGSEGSSVARGSGMSPGLRAAAKLKLAHIKAAQCNNNMVGDFTRSAAQSEFDVRLRRRAT
jgi:hypothetical protein